MNINKVILITDSNINTALTYCRVFTNVSTSEAYQRIFKAIIETIEDYTGLQVKIRHIHGDGWACIMGDLDLAQAQGLGMTLHELDNSKTWEDHLVYIFKSCRVHYRA